MKTTYAPSFAKVSLSPEAEKRESFLKAVTVRAKEFKDHYIKYYSKVADGLTTRIGRQARGIVKKSEDGALAGLWKETALTAMILDEPIIDWKAVKDMLRNLSFNFEQGAHTPAIKRPLLNQDFKTSIEYVSNNLADAFKEHVAGHKFAAKHTASSIADNTFVGPLRPAMQSLTADFMNEKISKSAFEDQASSTLLGYQGIVYSKADDGYAIRADKLSDMRASFEKSTEEPSLGRNPILVFRDIAQVHSPDMRYSPAVCKPVLQPAPAPTI